MEVLSAQVLSDLNKDLCLMEQHNLDYGEEHICKHTKNCDDRFTVNLYSPVKKAQQRNVVVSPKDFGLTLNKPAISKIDDNNNKFANVSNFENISFENNKIIILAQV